MGAVRPGAARVRCVLPANSGIVDDGTNAALASWGAHRRERHVRSRGSPRRRRGVPVIRGPASARGAPPVRPGVFTHHGSRGTPPSSTRTLQSDACAAQALLAPSERTSCRALITFRPATILLTIRRHQTPPRPRIALPPCGASRLPCLPTARRAVERRSCRAPPARLRLQ